LKAKVVPNDQVTSTSPPVLSASPTSPISREFTPTSSTITQDTDAFDFEFSSQFKAVLQTLKLAKGPFAGEYKCTHCRNNKTKLIDRDLRGSEIICGCTKNKAVCEALLVKKGILVSGNDQILRDLSWSEWYKLDHIMAALFGYNTSWLLDASIMKAGLQAAINNL